MKRKRLLLIPLFLSTLFSLSACQYVTGLFNDDDLSYSNHYNPYVSTPADDPNAVIAGGVKAQENEATPNAYCFKSISYASDNKVKNTYKVGGVNYREFNVNGGEDYEGSKSKNNFDLYVPKELDKTKKQTAILFIHGGAWIMGFKTDVNEYVHEFANRGYITATIKYTLLKSDMNDSSLSIFRNLDEIDACIASLKSALNDLGFDTASKIDFVIGGASSGSHLAMLYSYSRGNKAALPIKFIVNAVGPVDIKPSNWKRFTNPDDSATLDAGLSYSAIEALRSSDGLSELAISANGFNSTWNDYQTMRIANGMCGIPFPLSEIEATTDENKRDIVNPNTASNAMTRAGGGEDLLSVTYWMNATNKIPMIAAYAGKDFVVGIAQYAKLEKAFDDYGITHHYTYFRDSGHTNLNEDSTNYQAFVNKIDEWCKAETI